ncbi:MAG: hypothetical protein AB8B67_03785 [Rickettsiaceae bacterium]
MMICEEILEFAKINQIKFISMKFIDVSGNLLQIDSLILNLKQDKECFVINDFYLLPNRYFIDPFRAIQTISCVCENLTMHNSRALINEIINDNIECEYAICDIYCHIIDKKVEASKKIEKNSDNCIYQVDPFDGLSNLRTEITEILDNLDIMILHHHHGLENSSINITIKSNISNIADEILILRYVISNVSQSYGKIASYDMQNNDNYRDQFSVSIKMKHSINTNIIDDQISDFTNLPISYKIKSNTSSNLIIIDVFQIRCNYYLIICFLIFRFFYNQLDTKIRNSLDALLRFL